MLRKASAAVLVLMIVFSCLCAQADASLSFTGVVVAGEKRPVTAAYGGRVTNLTLRKGDLVEKNDTIADIATTLNYAPLEGTVTGIFASEGDDAESIVGRYNAIMFIEPTNRYTITATTENAYNKSENKYVHLGESVYLSCTADGTHRGTGIISSLTDTGYVVEVTGGEFYMGETVGIYRQADYAASSRIGRGTVGRTAPVAVKGTGSILRIHVANGDFVERGELLFETVDGTLDGMFAPDGSVLAPVSGVIASVDVAAGASVNKGDVIATIYPSDSMQIEFTVPEENLFDITEGQRVSIEFYWDDEENMTCEGTISSISHLSESGDDNAAGAGRGSYKAYVSFEPDARVRMGMTVFIYTIDENAAGHGDEPEETDEAPDHEAQAE